MPFDCLIRWSVLDSKYSSMDQEALMISLFFTFMLGAGIGFLLARIIF